MFNRNIFICIYILFFFQFINAKELIKGISKDEVLNITMRTYISFYCKNDICSETYHNYIDHFIEIPDENGNSIKYITDTCTYEKVISNDCESENCTSDSQCLSNKCIYNHCVFNEETPIVHCDDIYTPPSFISIFYPKPTYMYCGKPYKDTCKSNDDCSSKSCSNGICNMQNKGPSDSQGFSFIFGLIFLVFTFIVMPLICCCCRCFSKYKKNKY